MNATPYLQRLFCAGLVLSMFGGCMDNTHHIDQVQNDVLLFANGMSLNVGTTDSITLSSLLDSAGLDFLMADENGNYKISMTDTLEPIDLAEDIPVVELELQPEDIAPVTVSFDDFNFPTFRIDPLNESEEVDAVAIGDPFESIDDTALNDSLFSVMFHISTSDALSGLVEGQPVPAKVPFTDEAELDHDKAQLSLTGTLPDDVSQVHNVTYTGESVIKITLDRSDMIIPDGYEFEQKLNLFTLTCPSGFKLSPYAGDPGQVSADGTTYILSGDSYTLPASNAEVVEFRILFEKMDIPVDSIVGQELSYTADLKLDLDYVVNGTLLPTNSFQKPDDLNARLDVTTELVIEDMDISTHLIDIDPLEREVVDFSEKVDMSSAPEVTHVKSIGFEQGTKFVLKTGKLEVVGQRYLETADVLIGLPEEFVISSTQGGNGHSHIDSNGNLLLSADDLGQELTFYVDGVNFDDGGTSEGVAVDEQDSLLLEVDCWMEVANIQVKFERVSARQLLDALSLPIHFEYGIEFDEFAVNSGEVTTIGVSEVIDQQVFDLDISESIDPMLKKIYELEFSEQMLADLSVEGEGLVGFDAVTFANFRIAFPDFLVVSSEKGVLSDDNVLTLNESVDVVDGQFVFALPVVIEKIDFGAAGQELVDGTLDLNAQVTIDGSLMVPGGNVDTDNLSSLTITPKIALNTVQLTRVQAQIDIDQMDLDLSQAIDVPVGDTIIDAIKNLDLKDPTLTLTVGNTTAIALQCDLVLRAVYNDDSTAELRRTIDIDASPTMGENHVSHIVIRNESNDNRDLSAFLKQIPKELTFDLVPHIVGDKQVIDLESDNLISVSYDLNIPLDFGEDLEIVYETSFADLADALSQVFALTEDFRLYVDATSAVPLDLDLDLTPLDVMGNDMSDRLLLTLDKPVAAGLLTEPVTTQLLITIKELEKGAVEELGQLDLRIAATANSTVGGAKLEEAQWLKLSLKIVVPEGVKLQLNAADNNEELYL